MAYVAAADAAPIPIVDHMVARLFESILPGNKPLRVKGNS